MSPVSFFGSGSLDGVPPDAVQAAVNPADVSPPLATALTFAPDPLAENTAFAVAVTGVNFTNVSGRRPVAVDVRRASDQVIVAGTIAGYTATSVGASFGTAVDDGTWRLRVHFSDSATLDAGAIPVGNVVPVIDTIVLNPVVPEPVQAFTGTLTGSGFLNDRTPTAVVAVNEGTLAETAGAITGSPTDTSIAVSFASGLPVVETYHLRVTFSDAATANSDPFDVVLTYHSAVLALNPEAYWRLDDTTGDTLDATGNGHVGTISGAIARGQASIVVDTGFAYQFPLAHDAKSTIAYTAPLAVGASHTIVAWVRNIQARLDGRQNNIYALMDGVSLASWGYLISFGGTGWRIAFQSGDGANEIFTPGGTPIPDDNTPHMIVFRRDSVSGKNAIFLDGVKHVEGNLSGVMPAMNSVFLGGDNAASVKGFITDMDEVAYWPTTALTDQQIADLRALGV